MKPEEILEAAKEAYHCYSEWNIDLEHFTEIIEKVVEKRTIERCADYVDEVCTYGDTHLLVKAIRKLGEQ